MNMRACRILRRRRSLAWLLCLALVLAIPAPGQVYGEVPADGTEPVLTTYYRFVTGVIFLWGDTANPASWDPAAPGESYTVNTSAILPADAQNVSLQPYSPQTFDLDSTPNVIGRKDSAYYLSQYYPYAVNSLSLSLDNQPDGDGRITYSYTMGLTAIQTQYNVREKLEQPGGEQEIRDLMEYISPTMEQFLAKDKERVFGETIEAYLYFVPYLIQYQIAADDPLIPPPPTPTVTPPAIEGEAVLILPSYSYEGHPVPARDRSSFTVDGAAYSAQRLYAEGLGSNRFAILESGAGNIRSLTDTLAELIFSLQGLFHVKLTVETEDGDLYTDIETIQIRKTPYIEDNLGGSQKQNRRQDLNLHIATHPDYPLQEVQVTIQDPATGELLSQGYLNGSIQTGENSDGLKMRPMTRDALASDQYFTQLQLPFLTRPAQPGAPETRTYHYTVFARDSRGETHTVETDFAVLPDLAPQPAITMDQTFLRERDSNQAWITAEDNTLSHDGDGFLRLWEYTPADPGTDPATPVFSEAPAPVSNQPGYLPLSFGTDKQVGFQKDGVGPFQIRLSLIDHWTEPTLEEFLQPGDVLTGAAVASAEVDNVAPVVSRQTQKVVNTSMLLIGGSPEELDRMKNAKADFLQEFLRNGIDPRLQYALLGGKTPPQVTDVTALASFTHSSYGVEANGSVNEGELFTVDDKNFYMTFYTWPKEDGTNGVGEYPMAPFRVVAYDPYTGAQRWVYTTMDANRFSMGHDDTGTYLYLLYPGKTILLDKATGTVAGQVPLALGKQNFLTDRFLYTVSGANLIQLDRRTLTSRTVWAGASGARRIGNQIQFFHAGGDAISRGILDLESGTVTRERLYGKVDHPDFSPGAYSCLGIDARGTIILWKNPGFGSDTGRGFRIYDLQNRLIFSVDKAVTGTLAPSPSMALNEDGICNHLAVMEQAQTSTTCTQYVTAWNLRTGASATNSVSQVSSQGYPTNGLIASFETVGRSHFIYGSSWVYIVNFGLYTGQKHYTFSYDGAGSLSKSVMGPANLDVAEEYGAVSDRFAAFLLGDNSLGNSYLRAKVLAWPKTLTGELAQLLYRFAPTGAEDLTGRKHIILYDNTNSDLENGVEDAVKWIQETSASFLFAAGGEAGAGKPEALSAENYGNRIATLVGGVVSLVEEATRPIAQAIQDAAIEVALGYQPALQVTVSNPPEGDPEGAAQPGILTSTRKLEPGRQYFYEYDLKRLPEDLAGATQNAIEPLQDSTMKADFQIQRALGDQNILPDQQYYVTKVVEEDFNDGVVDSFFVRTGGGFSGGRFGVIGGSGGTRNLLRGGSATLKFTVPEGRRALVTMDYAMYHDDHGWQQGIFIDGQRFWNNQWNNLMDSVYSGSYHHPLLLTPGEHTIGISMNYYGYGTVGYYSAIDNLKVVFVDQNRPGSPVQHSAEELTNDWTRRKGSFTAPGTRISYGAQPMTYVDASLPGLLVDTYRTEYSLTVPAGMMAKTLAYPAGSAWGTGASGPNFTIGGKTMSMLPESNYPWKRIASGQQIYAGNLTGSNVLYATGSYSSSGSIPRVEQFLYPISASASADKVFYSKAIGEVRDPDGSMATGGWDRVYLENESSDGTATLQIQLPAGPGETQYLLQNVRLYYYEKGIKTYVEDNWISDLGSLSNWVPSANVSLAMGSALPGAEETDSDSLSFQKGQLVSFPMFYQDHEGDPSKRSYYRYLHEPFNDGLHLDAAVQLSESGAEIGGPGLGEQLPQGGRPAPVNPAITKVLTDPIERFYVDGKYVLQHWQEDQTDRSGTLLAADSPYDKLSNVEQVTFYIESGSLAPWITYIKTLPAKVREGLPYQLEVGVDDSEKDELRLRTEVYRKGELIFVHTQTGIRPDLSGTYPPVITGFVPPPDPGVYQVVCTVRDATGAGVGTHRFEVISEGKITGFVHHTVQWDLNRKHFNLSRFGEEYNQEVEREAYQALKAPRPRGTNVFWSGEKLMLTADLAGNPLSVEAGMVGNEIYQTTLSATGRTNDAGETIYEGSLWDGAMIGLWGRKVPEEIVVRFVATYAGDQVLTFDVPILFDSSTAYWNLHRVW